MTEEGCCWLADPGDDPHDCCTCFDTKYVLDKGCRCMSCYGTPCPDCNPDGQSF